MSGVLLRLHVESIYGAYHGQDPRTFSPDEQSCSPAEIQAHKAACQQAEAGSYNNPNAGCLVTEHAIICRHGGLGIGIYQVVMTDEGEYVRDASYEDSLREGEWEELEELEAT